MANATITVTEVIRTPRSTKYGTKDTVSYKDTAGKVFSFGFKDPRANVGDTITFNYTEGKYGAEADYASVTFTPKSLLAPVPVVNPTPAPKKEYGPPAKVFPIPPLHGDRAIVRQNSLTNAVSAFNKFHDGYTYPMTGGEELDVEKFATHIISLARKFEAYSCGDLDLETAKAMLEKEGS